MVNDPVGDLIIRLKNAGAVGHEQVSIPFSNFRLAVLEKLKDAGYIKNFERKGKKVVKTIEVELAYDKNKTPRINGVKRISKPGRRMYTSASAITPVKHGHGSLIISTPKGVLKDVEAKKENVGGEALFEIW